MACSADWEKCYKCKGTKKKGQVCRGCVRKKKEEAWKKRKAHLATLSIEERLNILEEAAFNPPEKYLINFKDTRF